MLRIAPRRLKRTGRSGRQRRRTSRWRRTQQKAAWFSTRWTSSSSSRCSAGPRCTGTRPQTSTLWMALAVLAICPAAGRRHPWPGHRSQPHSVRRRTCLWLCLQDGRGCDRQGRVEVFPLHHDAVHVHRLLELPWPAADGLHHHSAYRRNGVMAMAVFLFVTILGFVKNGAGFLSLFWISARPLRCARFWR